MTKQTIPCFSVCQGDRITFQESVFVGRYPRSTFAGVRTIVADVQKESYGGEKQQHSFTLNVVRSEGFDPLPTNTKIIRKGRNIYKHGVRRELWTNELDRARVLVEKHERGNLARLEREQRKIDYI